MKDILEHLTDDIERLCLGGTISNIRIAKCMNAARDEIVSLRARIAENEALQAECDDLLAEVRGLREKVRYFEDTFCCPDIHVMLSNGCRTMAIDPERVTDVVWERDRLRQTAGKAAGWVSVDDSLPDMDVPVWLQTDHGVLIGLRTDAGDEGWLWGRCYSAPWINRDGVWVADGECDDDYHATAWHPLPVPPKVSGEDEK